MFLNGYPYTDFHEMNADFILRSVELLKQAFSEFTATNSIIFAEPLLHDLTKSYAKNTIVLDENGNAFISLKVVPAGVQLSNTEYWMLVFNFESYTEKANKNFTDNYFRDTTRTTYALDVDDWVVLDDVLYKVVVAIPADGLFEIGTNIIHFTIEQFVRDFVTYVTTTLEDYSLTIQQYKNDIDASEAQYKHDIDVSEAQYKADMDASEAAYQAAMQAEVDRILAGATVDSEVIDARLGADDVEYSTLGNAIRNQIGDVDGKEKIIINAAFNADALPLYATVAGYGLNDIGNAEADPDAELRKYQVTAGDLLHIKAQKQTTTCWMFSSSASPGSGNLVGFLHPESTDDYFIVPSGATYLLVGTPAGNTTNRIEKMTFIIDDEIDQNSKEITFILDEAFTADTVALFAKTLDYELNDVGNSLSNNDAEIRKYAVTPGNLMFIKAEKMSDTVWYFSSSASPGSGNVVGGLHQTATEGFYFVPSGATYLLVSAYKTNTTNVIKNYVFDLDEKVANNTNVIATAVKNIDSRDIRYGADDITNVTLDTGWSGDFDNGFTHSPGSNYWLNFDTNGVANERYLIQFDVSGGFELPNTLWINLGGSYPVDIYNGDTHIAISLKCLSNNATLRLMPASSASGVIRNISCCKISSSGANVLIGFPTKSYGEDYLPNNYTGYWNVVASQDGLKASENATRSIAIGLHALKSLMYGNRNIAIGTFALEDMTTGESNIAIGADAFFESTQNSQSVSIGVGSSYEGDKYNKCVAVGNHSLRGVAGETKNECVAIGYQAAMNFEGDNSTVIGANCLVDPVSGGELTLIGDNITVDDGVFNSVGIGHNAHVDDSNEIVIGNSNVSKMIIGNKQLVFNLDGTVGWTSI